jgi:hypothetical protein
MTAKKPDANAASARPCKLQVNTTGAWRNVLDFDARNGDQIMAHAAHLFAWAGPKTTLRIIAPSDTAPLMTWSPDAGWRKWRNGA